MAILTITGTPASGMQMTLFVDLPQQLLGPDTQTKLEYRELLLYFVAAYHSHRHGNPYQRNLSRIERDRPAHYIHQLGGLAAAW